MQRRFHKQRKLPGAFREFLVVPVLLGLGLLLWVSYPASGDELGLIVEEEDAPVQAHVMLGVGNFDQWVFGAAGTGNGSELKTRQHFQNMAKTRIERIDQMCKLTEPQKKKLELAARGDMVHFFDRVEVVREKFMRLRNDQNKIQEIWQDIQPLQVAIQSEQFSTGSFFRKTLQRTLTGDQFSQFEKAELERRKFVYRAKILAVVVGFESTIPMTGEQRHKLVDLVEKETPIPRGFGQYDQYVVMYQMGKIPSEKLRKIFDESQMKMLDRRLNQGRGMGAWLERTGMLGEEKGEK